MMWGYHGYGFAGMGLGMILFWVLIIAAIVVLARGFGTRSGPSEPSNVARTPLDILGQRYARGEIDKEEFATKRRDLSAT